MKKITKMYAAIIICIFTLAVTSCSENKIDKLQDEALKGISMVEKNIEDNDVSQEAIDALQKESPQFMEAIMELKNINKDDLTEKQKEKATKIEQKMFILLNNRKATPYMQLLMRF